MPVVFLQVAFFHRHGCTTNDTNAKYSSRAAQLYREKIKSLATQATRKHGTEVSPVGAVSHVWVLEHVGYQDNLKFITMTH